MTLLVVLHGRGAAANGPTVTAETGCPSADDLRTAIADLLPGEPGDGALTLTQNDPGAVQVRTVDADGRTTLRNLPVDDRSCAERARAVAVVWAAATTQVPSASSAGTPQLPRPAAVQVTTAKAAGLPPAESRLATEIGAGVLVGWSGASSAPSGELGFALVGPSGVGGRLTAGLDGSMTTTVDPGEARWYRWHAAAGLLQRWSAGRWRLEAEPAVVYSWVAVTGHGYSRDQSGSVRDLGARLSARFGRTWERRGFLGLLLRADGWFGEQALLVSGVESQGRLPRWSAFAGLAADWQLTGKL